MAVVGDIYNALDAFCPFDVHEQWDNVGPQVQARDATWVPIWVFHREHQRKTKPHIKLRFCV